MKPDELEILLEPFRAIEAYVQLGHDDNGEPFVLGIQCHNRRATDEHVALLPLFPSLRAVGLEGTDITDAAIANFVALPRLESLDLDRTAVTDAGLSRLAGLSWLEYLHVEHTQVTEAGIADLQKHIPKCEIVSDWT